jgi:hypothetical protein
MGLSLNSGKTTNMLEGSAGGGAYGAYGVGNTTETYREATRKGKYPSDNTGPSRSQGETPGAGSIYAAMLNERPNISNPRNRGPERAPSRSGGTPIPITSMASRAVSRVTG